MTLKFRPRSPKPLTFFQCTIAIYVQVWTKSICWLLKEKNAEKAEFYTFYRIIRRVTLESSLCPY